eukprot:9472864-Pyramimonas_sp.AAC.1
MHASDEQEEPTREVVCCPCSQQGSPSYFVEALGDVCDSVHRWFKLITAPNLCLDQYSSCCVCMAILEPGAR